MAEGTFLVANIRDFVRFTQEQGNQAAARLETRFTDLMGEGAEARGGTLATRRPGEATVLFTSTTPAIRAALELQGHFEREVQGSPASALPVGIGLATGPFVQAAGTYVGSTVKLAERLCAVAGPGEVLASDVASRSAGDMARVKVIERGHVQLRGFMDPVAVYQLVSLEIQNF
jgi:adenylate cyclase